MATILANDLASIRREFAASNTVAYPKGVYNLAAQAIEDWWIANAAILGTAINTATSPNVLTTAEKSEMSRLWRGTPDLAGHVGSKHVPFVNVLDFGADPNYVADSSPAINAAILALPSTGGTVYLPAGDYKCLSTLNLGNGSASAFSTRQGIILQGAAGPGSKLLNAIPRSDGQIHAATRLVCGTATTLVSVNGPLNGWGLRDLELDGNLVGNIGLDEIACNGGQSWNLTVAGFRQRQQRCRALPRGALTWAPAHRHNTYSNLYLGNPLVNNVIALECLGNGVDQTSNCCFDVWDNLAIVNEGGRPVTGFDLYGMHLQSCDDQTFRNIEFFNFQINGGGHGYCIHFDYTGPFTVMPSDCLLDQLDFGTKNVVQNFVINSGTPGGSMPNRVKAVTACNGVMPNPGLANLEWEGMRHKAGPPIAADIPPGCGGIWRDTTGNTTKLYYNNAGVIIASVAFS